MLKIPDPETVIDDATRSVSVRLSVMDYGRIRTLAGQLKVRESVAFRLLVHAGLSRLDALYRPGADAPAVDAALAELAEAARREGLEVARLTRALASSSLAARAGLSLEALRDRLEPAPPAADDAGGPEGVAGVDGEGQPTDRAAR